MTTASPPQPNLPATYLKAEAAARPELDRPDHTKLAQLLAMGVVDCAKTVAATSDDADLALREALPRAARILDPYTFVPINNYPPDVDRTMAAIEGTCPVMRRFAAAQYEINVPRQDTSWGKQLPPFPDHLGPDGDCIYVPYEEGAAGNVTLESVAAQQAKDGAGVVRTIDPPEPVQIADHPSALPTVDKPTIIAVEGGSPNQSATAVLDIAHDNEPSVHQVAVTVQTKEGFFQHLGTEIHEVIERALAWCAKVGQAAAAEVKKL